ncbi:DegV family protein [Fictibacillus phosphorivorans]|uniref:DegV family protein n=1 Tax=Fictibacillus phosphorivorans TaxID=1221500 RepID=UPI00203C217E|nr:DegV family protein [Fictibacillus phosphorivorans]MCM3718570.1 DegV family protein [Fictibacillus phosphorivorans]MCM3776193.1 DegV family protein [Fictibacillus phosphorivorans]
MARIAWITDSTSCITQEEAKQLGIHIVPVSVIMGEEVYKDGVDITPAEFYERMEMMPDLPKTSQPTVGEFSDFYEVLKLDYDCGIAVHISEKFSGTINGSRIGAEMADFPIHIVDSKITSEAMKQLILKGKRLEDEGLDPEVIAERLRGSAANVKGYVCIGNLEQLRRGGRLSGASFLVGNLLQIKPILTFEDGSLVPFEKIRTLKKAQSRVLELFEEAASQKSVNGVSVVYSGSSEKAEDWLHLLKEKYPDLTINLGQLSPAIGVHVGAGTLGILWFEE